MREPDQALLARLMLQRDGCAGDVVFLVYSSVRSLVPLLPASCSTTGVPSFIMLLELRKRHCCPGFADMGHIVPARSSVFFAVSDMQMGTA